MKKWLTFQYSFVCIQISPSNLVLELKTSIEYFTLNEASEANLNAGKIIVKCQPFLRKVYLLQPAVHHRL